MDKKAQAGLEYLVTYGWALVLVAAVVGTLVLIVGGPLAEPAFSSSDPTKLLLKGANVENGVATIKLQNVTGGEIEIEEISSTGYYNCLASNTSNTVIAGGELEILCAVPADLVQGEVAVQYADASGLVQNTLISGGGGTVPMGAPAPPTGENTDYLCSDGFENDGDSLIDCEDPDCIGKTGTGQYPAGARCEFGTETSCADGFDNDGDGDTDTADSDCPNLIASCPYTIDVPGNYQLAGNLTSTGTCITINANDVTLDCENQSITGQDVTSTYGVTVSGKQNVTIQNCIVKDYYFGIDLRSGASNNTISNNTLEGNLDGIQISNSNNNEISNNAVNSNGYTGIFLNYSSSNTVTENTVNNSHQGIYVYYSSDNTLTSNIITSNNIGGIYIYRSINNTFITNESRNNSFNGFWLGQDSTGNNLSGNIATGNSTGFRIATASNQNTLSDNVSTGNTTGFSINDSQVNVFNNNNACGNNTDIYCNTWLMNSGNGNLADEDCTKCGGAFNCSPCP